MISLQQFNGLKKNVCERPWGNTINFDVMVMADRSCAYFDLVGPIIGAVILLWKILF